MTKPILFSRPMVQAIIAGRKTQTRRIVKPQPEDSLHNDSLFLRSLNSALTGWNGVIAETGESKPFKCPYGQPSDILWVRETWRKYCRVDEMGYTHFEEEIIEFAADDPEPIYLLDGDGAHEYNKDGSEKYVPWRPSIFMPKEACRLFLKIKDVRVERLQEISEEDAKAEGVEKRSHPCGGFGVYEGGGEIHDCVCQNWLHDPQVMGFMDLWQMINGPESWEANPWVWVISFEKTNKPGI